MPAEVLRKWCQATVYHGIKDLYEAKNLITKLIWLTLVMIGCFFAVTQSVELILSFALDDKWETIISSEKALNDEGIEWPNVTICSPLVTVLDTIKTTNHSWSDPREIAATFGTVGINIYEKSNKTGNEFSEAVAEDALKRSRSVSCDDMVLDCGPNHGFHSRLYCNCSSVSQITFRANCFKINLGNVMSDSHFMTEGYDSGTKLLLNPRTKDYYENLIYDEKGYAGIILRIYFGEDEADGIASPIFVAPGTMAAIAMTAEKHRTSLRKRRTLTFYKPEEPCYRNHEYKWLKARTISRSLCKWDCYATFLIEYCQCVFVINRLTWRDNATVCSKEAEHNCSTRMKEINWKSQKLDSGFDYNRCLADCKGACEFNKISTQISTSQFPAASKVKPFTQFINRVLPSENFTDDDTRQLIMVQLFYESSEYRLISTVNRGSLDELISNIGGTLGVWTGLSLIGIFQAILYMLYCAERAIKLGYNRLSDRVVPLHHHKV